MIGFRIVKTKYLDTAWSGYGAQRHGGRWNHKGNAMIYLATSVSLATLECLVHFDDSALLQHYTLLSIEVSDTDIIALEPTALPTNWQQLTAPQETMDIGSEWLDSGSSVGLLVPSSVVPMENNILINPQHTDFTAYLSSVQAMPHIFDPRLK
ncbi:RES family NAD+ phosphorylase [Serratia sp. UGAL515B_01]|uniref:RES family NAD+ phosphorylase n=1 Tax=Serratia sp. UGAL515B_01 TaxID=2986763 RepID=UPI002954ACF7|nr:RES domain-containing protein [Serratia sp. UGAL515B_01]WON77933.1 RES domain-containing protein [Serratia sp. UGAL515B_01]